MTRPSSPALSAFGEIGLWKDYLATLPGGVTSFPQWTFWPATVFSSPAARALCQLFRHDATLKDILRRSGVWATEEVLLPSLAAALGFRVLRSPCDRSLVRFRMEATPLEVDQALDKPDCFWIHPVPRDMTHPLRAYIRSRCLP
jgi:hypothetical protein